MATLLQASVLSDEEKSAINGLAGRIRHDENPLSMLDRTYDAEQRISHIGLSVPLELREITTTIINIPRIAVDEPVLRQHVRGFYRAGDSTKEDADLRAAWEANNLASESTVVHTDEKIFGRTFVSVGANPDSKDRPIISAEDPRQIGVEIDTRARRITAGLRLYRDEKDRGRTRGTLYLPDSTTHIVRSRTGWVIDEEYGRDEHGLGVVPLVGFIHCRRTGNVAGRSEMSDVIKMTEDVARLFSNMMTTADALATPGRWAAGVKKEDFVDRDGKPLPTWEAYITAIKATSNSDAKFGQFEAAQLSNFFETVNNVFAWCAAVLGLPTRYAGQQTVNPAAEGAIRADESRLIGRVERMNRFDGDSWSWVMGLEERFRTGSWGDPNSIRVLWRDPATPTVAQVGDVAVKYRSVGAISLEGMWDMLGWDEPRKAQERARLKAEAADDVLSQLLRPSDASVGA